MQTRMASYIKKDAKRLLLVVITGKVLGKPLCL